MGSLELKYNTKKKRPMSCVVPSILAYFTLAYLAASLVYVLVT